MDKSWHHAPPHVFIPESTYIVTAGTLDKAHLFRSDDRLRYLQDTLLITLDKNKWIIQAWAVFANHYHFVARAPESGTPIGPLLQELHSKTAIEMNRLDRAYGRQVWFEYWDTCLTYVKSWLARLHYVNDNAVHHGLVRVASAYPYCSATRFEQQASSAFRRKVNSFKYDKIKIVDDF